MRPIQVLAVVGVLTAALAAPTQAQDWPVRPLTLVVAFPAGGSDDALARILAPRLSELLGQLVSVENVSGAGGMTGAARVAQAPPDGHVLILGSSATHALSQVLNKTPLYNAATDFTPVALIAEQPFVLIAHKDTPTSNLRDFIAYAKANALRYGSAGAGSATHLVCAVLNGTIGIKAAHAPYNGGAPALCDLIAGRVDYFCPVITIAIPQIEKATVNAVAILSKDRSPNLPNLMSAHEQGLSDFPINTWFALFTPKGTPAPIVRRLHEAITATMDTPSVRAQLKDIAADVAAPDRRSPDYLKAFVESEIAKWSASIKASGVVIE